MNRDHAIAAPNGRSPAGIRSSWALCLFAILLAVAVGISVLLARPASTQVTQEYIFTKVADSTENNFDPFAFGCAAINDRGDIAFRAGRVAGDGNTFPGVYRADAGGGITTIAQDRQLYDFINFSPSINDSGEVSFAAGLDREDPRTGDEIENILRGDGGELTTIASTEGRYNFFVFETSVNNDGRVAFAAELDERFGFDEGLFSGTGGRVTTYYLASNSRFTGSTGRPSINNSGEIAFGERRDRDIREVIFLTDGNSFTSIGEEGPAPDDSSSFLEDPVLNDEGTVLFETTFFDPDTDEQVTEIVTGTGGPLTTLVDTRGEFANFGFRTASLNDDGDIAFRATLDDFETSGIFVGPDPVEDRVVAVGDTLDGHTVQNLVICEEGLNDSGQLAISATLEDPESPDGFREAIFRVTPRGPRGCTIVGTQGDDTLRGTRDQDVICARGGDDTIQGRRANDTIYGDAGDDTIEGNNASDTLVGGGGSDQLFGQFGNDRLEAEDGVSGNDTLDGGAGTNRCQADTGDTTLRCS